MSTQPQQTTEKVAPGVPVAINKTELARFTVAEIKAELKGRDVRIPSKLRKQELLELLQKSLHLPVLNFVEAPSNGKQKKEGALAWNESHPARALLYSELQSGKIPLDADEMDPAEVHQAYSDTLEFQMKGMEYGPAFVRRLGDLRKKVQGDTSRASLDLAALKAAIRRHPPPPLNWRGQPQWNGSVAQALLQYDMSLGKHKQMMPHELRMDRIEYQAAASVDQFRWKIQQEERTKKYLYTLKFRAEQKLRSNLKKDGFIFDEDNRDETESTDCDEDSDDEELSAADNKEAPGAVRLVDDDDEAWD